MSAVETEMVVRNLNAGLLRAITHVTLGTILDLKLGREMSGAMTMFGLSMDTVVREIESPFGKDKIPAPQAARDKSNALIAKFAEDLQNLYKEILTED